MNRHDCVPGRRATVSATVGADDTAEAIGSGDVPVMATPRVLAMAEAASVRALGACLAEGETSVGSWVEVEHRRPSAVGDVVEAEAVLLGVHGRRLEFSVIVRRGTTEVARVRLRRIVVDRESFLARDGDAPDAADC